MRYALNCSGSRFLSTENQNYSMSTPGGFCLLYLLLCKDFVKFDLIRSVVVACENISFFSLFAAGDVSYGGTSTTQRQKFHTDDVKSVRSPVRSADWSTE